MEAELLAWYRQSARELPWREMRDPYAILVSEVMAQQTQIDRVVPRWERWLERWPTVDALATAEPGDVIREWQGLGYNRRALSLHRAAQQVAAHGWPDDLTELPGVGRYTADAVARFAFGRDVLPVDVNVRRVSERTGYAFSPEAAQALMDLGATVCLARVPRCDVCPLADACPSRGRRYEPLRKQGAVRGLVPAAAVERAPRGRRRRAARRRRGGRRARPRRPRRGARRPRLATIKRAVIASIVTLLIPLWILLGVVALMGVLILLGRIRGGRYLRPVINLIAKVPLFKRWLQKASTAALERSNPELASAMRKMQRSGALRDPNRAQAAMSTLTRQERQALIEMQEEQGAAPEATNRQMRRRMEKARRDAQRRGR